MRVLFLVHNVGKTRHFESVIQRLVKRGHTVIVAAARKRKPLKLGKGLPLNRRLELTTCPARRVDAWDGLATSLRLARDYTRFLDARYIHATKLAGRAADNAPPGFSSFVEQRPWIRRHPQLLGKALAWAETVIPPDKYFELFIRSERPDVVLVTPLVDFGSFQTDYIKSAHRLGIPVAFLPFSWDNLTNRGLVRVEPDRVLVWNEIQKREAIELHEVAPDRVVVTGAPRFDGFFAMRPSRSRDEFCADIGLDPSRPFILYVCSSEFVAPQEVEFVRRWAHELRASREAALRTCGVLVRPHPAHAEQWQHANLSDLDQVALWSARSTMNADQGLYNSLHHTAAVVGLNTSAMIEAGILGKPVYTVLTPEFAGGQVGTLHFTYLRQENGGPVFLSHNIEEHHRQLANALEAPSIALEQSRRFTQAFVRPRGLKVPATKIVVEEIERAAAIKKRKRRTPAWHFPLRWLLLALLRSRRPQALCPRAEAL